MKRAGAGGCVAGPLEQHAGLAAAGPPGRAHGGALPGSQHARGGAASTLSHPFSCLWCQRVCSHAFYVHLALRLVPPHACPAWSRRCGLAHLAVLLQSVLPLYLWSFDRKLIGSMGQSHGSPGFEHIEQRWFVLKMTTLGSNYLAAAAGATCTQYLLRMEMPSHSVILHLLHGRCGRFQKDVDEQRGVAGAEQPGTKAARNGGGHPDASGAAGRRADALHGRACAVRLPGVPPRQRGASPSCSAPPARIPPASCRPHPATAHCAGVMLHPFVLIRTLTPPFVACTTNSKARFLQGISQGLFACVPAFSATVQVLSPSKGRAASHCQRLLKEHMLRK